MTGAPIFDKDGQFKGYHGIGRNITDRKRAEEALRKSEARFRSLTELSSDWYWEQDENMRFTYLSSGAKALAGPRAEYTIGPIIGKSRWEIPDVTPLSCSWAEHQAVLAARQPFRDFEYRRLYPDGLTRYVSVSGEPLFDAQGCFKGYQGVARNITDRRRIEEELRARQDMLDLAQKAAHAAAFEWRITAGEEQNRWSPDLEALYGLAPGFYDGTFETWTQLVHPEDQPAANAAFERAKKTGDLAIEYRVRLQGGAVRWLQAKGRVVFDSDGKPERMVGFMIDVTDRHKADEELQRSRHYLAEAQKLSHTGSWAFNAAGFGYWSPELFRIHGLDPGGKAPSIPKYLALVHPEDRDFVLQEIEKMLAGAERFDFTKRIVRPDGAIRLVRCVGIRANPGGIYPEFVGTGMDVTEQERAEDELRRLEKQLRQAQRLEAMGTLAGGIAHDFNNLLGAILGYGEMALRNAPSGSRLRRDLENILIAGERGRALVDRILGFSRSGIGEHVPVHVEKVIRETLALFSARLTHDIVLKQRLRSGRAAVLGDATQIHQVLMNLATNAVQAMPSGGVLRVSLDSVTLVTPKSVAIGSVAAKDYVVLRVADSGTGMPPEVLEKIFDPFFSTKEVGVGTGLGLSLVHGIVTGLGGAIDVETTVGKGSAFTVYLPRSGDVASTAPISKRSKSIASHGHRERILVVDDEESLVNLVGETLEDLGYVVDGFTSSVAALRAFDDDPQRFDAVITDESMPSVSGSELIKKIRAQRPKVPILLLSGYLTAATVRRALQAGADDVLRKPLSARDLGTSLARVLRHSRRSSRPPAAAPSTSRRSGLRPTQPRTASPRRTARR
jgi:PAS domain S-box-containing protein